jgi:archaellum biogenesis protein FlaJ (TadC family)
MYVITAMYFATSCFGYWAYGDMTVSPILHNLPKGVAATVATVFITIHVLLACPILLCSFSIEFEKRIRLGDDAARQRFIIRSATLGCLVVISLLVPYFAGKKCGLMWKISWRCLGLSGVLC